VILFKGEKSRKVEVERLVEVHQRSTYYPIHRQAQIYTVFVIDFKAGR